MKLKILSIFFIVFVAQTQVAQGSPLGLSLNLGGLIGSATNILTGTVTTVTNTLNTTLSLLNNVLNSVVQAIGNVATQTTLDIKSAIAAGGHLVSDGANLIANAAGDAISTVNTALINTAAQVLPIIDNTLEPVTNFGNVVSNLIANKTALLSNPIDSINQAIAGLSSTLNGAGLFQPAIYLITQSLVSVGKVLQPLAAPIANILSNIATSIPASISSGLNTVTAVSGNIDNVLAAASNLTNALAAQVAAGTQPLSASVVPITATLNTTVNNIANAVNSAPAQINNVISGLQNAAAALEAAYNAGYQNVVSSLAAVGTACVNDVVTATDNLATNIIGKTVACLTSEIPTLQNYLVQYQNLAAQYLAGSATNTLSISTLQQTIQISVDFKLYLLSTKFRVESCLAVTLLNASGNFLPLALSAVNCVG